jgi:hypothetical protein
MSAGIKSRLEQACAAALDLGTDPEAAERVAAEDAQLLLAAAVRLYGARVDAGLRDPAFPAGHGELAPTATDVVVTASAMLKASQIELFELGMWQTWSGGAA